MKRLLAFLTATLMLALCLCVPASANCYVDEFSKTTPLWNADEESGQQATTVGKFELDTENQLEGAGCISMNFSNGPHFDASITVPTVDTTNVTALEFDMYISDLAILECLAETRAAIQLSPVTNSQVTDGKLTYGIHHVAKEMIRKGPKVGWNHVVILLEYMVDLTIFGTDYKQVDLSNINCLRIYLMNIKNADPNWELKFDNFVFTDRQKGNHTGEWESDKACHSTKCTVCEENVVEYHRYGERITVKEPTEIENGLAAETCLVCGYVQKHTIPKTGSQTPQPDDPKTDTNTDGLGTGCTGMIGGAWSVLAVLSLAGWAIRKKQK